MRRDPRGRGAHWLAPALLVLSGCGASSNGTSSHDGGLGGAGVEDGATDAGVMAGGDGGACGGARGAPLHVASGIDLCLPQVVCTAETCPPPLGDCIGGVCRFKPGYAGLATVPQAWATYYCTLSTGGCNGVTQLEKVEVTAAGVSARLGLPLCEGSASGTCVGIAASSPMVVGNSQVAVDPSTGKFVSAWGLGLTEASGLCYELDGPGGTVLVALTDRCGGYCKCKGSGYQECGPCVSAPDMEPNCACVGPVPGLYTNCCGNGCASPVEQACDWCASNNHPHFDLDTGAFGRLCGAESGAGSCRITGVRPVVCATPVAWPPGGGGSSCQPGSFACSASAPHQVAVPGTSCCCNCDLTPQTDGTCH